jgi:hypothetical protein
MCVLSLFRPVLSANSLVDTHECFADWQQSKKIFQKKTARLSPAVQVKGGNALEEGSNSGGLSLVPMFHMEKSWALTDLNFGWRVSLTCWPETNVVAW